MADKRIGVRRDDERLIRIGSAIGLLIVWQLGAWAADSRMLPTVTAVLQTTWRLTSSGELPWNMGITLARMAVAFIVSLLLGGMLGLAMGCWRRLDAVLDNTLTVLLNLPALVVIVLLYIWFGLNEVTAVGAVVVNKLPSTAVMVREGARAMDGELMRMARSFGLPRWRLVRHVMLPQIIPYIIAAARSGLALIWKIVLVVELLGRGNGVGFEIETYFQLFDVTSILAYTLVFVVIVQLIEWLALQPLERWLGRWRASATG